MKVIIGQINKANDNFADSFSELLGFICCRLSFSLCLFLICVGFCSNCYSQQLITEVKFDEKQLKENFEKFISQLDTLSISTKYPEITKKILSSDAKQQTIALRMLSESEEVDAIPWAILLLNSDDKYIRVYAGNAIQEIVSSTALKRRDSNFPQYVLIKPLEKSDIDLKPLAWLVLKLLKDDDPNLCGYSITMARYLNLYEFREEILKRRDSPHPAVTDTVKWAIESLELQKRYESGELQKSVNQR